MAWSDQQGQYALAGASQVIGYLAAAKKAAADRKWQEYNNKMTRLANAQNQNSITANEILTRKRNALEEFNIRLSGDATKAKIEAQAAATGTTGRSVEAALFDVSRNTANASARREMDWEVQQMQFNQNRQSSQLQTDTQIDYATIPSPNPASYLLGFAADAMDIKNKT